MRGNKVEIDIDISKLNMVIENTQRDKKKIMLR